MVKYELSSAADHRDPLSVTAREAPESPQPALISNELDGPVCMEREAIVLSTAKLHWSSAIRIRVQFGWG